MKTRLFIISVFLICSFPSISQTSGDIRGFSDFRLYYNLSFLYKGLFTMPYGAGLNTSVTLNKRLSIDFGLTVKPSKKEVEDFSFASDFGISYGHIHDEFRSFYMDIPIHINYQIIKLKSFRILGSVGPGLFYIKTTRNMTRTFNDREPTYVTLKSNNLNAGFNLGIIESINLFKNTGVFASQYYGKALLGYSKGFESTDLNFGLTYNF